MDLRCPGVSASQLKTGLATQGEERDEHRIKLTRAFVASNLSQVRQLKQERGKAAIYFLPSSIASFPH